MLFVLVQRVKWKVRNKILPKWGKNGWLIRTWILETSGWRIWRCNTYFWNPVRFPINNWWGGLQPICRSFHVHRAEMIYYMYTASIQSSDVNIAFTHIQCLKNSGKKGTANVCRFCYDIKSLLLFVINV